MKILNNFLCGEKEDLREIQNIEVNELDRYLSEFFVTLKKSDVSDYEPS